MRKITLAIIPLILGIGGFGYLVKTKPKPQSSEEEVKIRKVRFMNAIPVEIQRVATGYGRVSEARTWKAFSEVKGKIICLGFSLFHKKDLKKGKDFYQYLKRATTPLSQYIFSQLSKKDKERVHGNGYKTIVCKALNKVLRSKSLYTQRQKFSISLSKEMEKNIKNRFQHQNTIRINRYILQKIYADYVYEQNLFLEIKDGNFLPKGTAICQVDPTEYDLLVLQREIAIAKTELEIKELKKDLEYRKKIIKLEHNQTKLLKSEYKRKEKLYNSQTTSASEVDTALNNYLRQLNTLQEIKKQIDLTPIKLKNLEASIELSKAQLTQAKLDQAKTVIYAPFDIRITSENIETNQFVSIGQQLLEAYGIEEAEVLGEFQYNDIQGIFGKSKPINFRKHIARKDSALFNHKEIKAIVSLSASKNNSFEKWIWHGSISRISSSINLNTQTVPFVISVKNPYDKVIPGVKPPLVKGMYCQIQVLGQKHKNVFCIPRSAYQQGRLLIIEDGKLQIRKVTPKFVQDDYIIIEDNIEAGEQIILSDIFPAIPDTKLDGIDKTKEITKKYPWFVSKEKK